MQRSGAASGVQAQGIEEAFLLHGQAQLDQALGQDRGQLVDSLGDLGQALGTVVHGIHAGDVGQQDLGGADVAGGLLAADMLLAGLHGQAQGRLAETVHRDAHQAAGHVALEGIAGGEVGRMRATKAQGHAEALGTADGHVGAEFPGRGQQGQGQQVGGHGYQGVGSVETLGQLAVVEQVTVACRVLQQGAEERADVGQLALIAHHHVDPQGLGTGAQHIEGLWVAMLRGEEGVAALVLAQALAEGHGFGGGGAFVQQRGVGDRQAAQVADQGLEIQQGFQATLGDFRLVRGVGGVPGGVFQEVAQNRRRRMAVVVALADIGLEQLVPGGDGLDRGQGLGFAQALAQLQYAGALDALGNHAGAQGFQGVEAEAIEHGLLIALARADVARDEFVGGAQVDGHGGSSGFGAGFDQAVVGVLVQQLANGSGIGRDEAEEPAFAQRVFVDQFRAVFQGRVGGDHFTVQGHVHAAGGFHRFHGGGFGALVVALQLRQLHKHHITQGVLGESRNADGDTAIRFGTQPFVIFSKTQLAHGNSSGARLVWWTRLNARTAPSRMAMSIARTRPIFIWPL